MKNVLVTGGAGFIGSNFVRYLLQREPDVKVVTLDLLTYAGKMENLEDLPRPESHVFVQGDICNRELVDQLLAEHAIDTIVHFAAESHVDRSILGPMPFIQTNIIGTFTLLEAAKNAWKDKPGEFRFHHISTDEVYGALGETGLFTEETSYSPNSPYSASKASSDHLVRAWRETYGLPTVVTNCSNNYGPYHFPEKLIPLVILNAISGKPLPVYGKGNQVRDWLYVDDHARALYKVATDGVIGETYNIGGHNEKQNIDVVQTICALLEEMRPEKPAGVAQYRDLITHVADRPGHDVRYAIDASKIQRELGWSPEETFDSGIRKTVRWYLDNQAWWQHVLDGSYQLQRLGLNK